MHQHAVAGIGKAPGRMPRAPSFEEACRIIASKIDAIERGAEIPEAEMAEARRDWALRRGSG